MSLIRKLLCAVGYHGPLWNGARTGQDSLRTAPFERTCGHCGAVWHGREVNDPYVRRIGDWVKVKTVQKKESSS